MKFRAIKENHLYHKAYAGGKKCITKTVAVYVLRDWHAKYLKKENPQKEYVNRIGISVSKKLGGAVVRNRAKRIIRAGFYEADKKLSLRRGYLIVLAARDGIVSASSKNVYSDLCFAFHKLELDKSGENS
ncbi:MAG: ribonuclease P protein component [Clostridia bacterium]|nr:ribonuclease P protein component [Clostridia bacterium]